VTVGNRTDPDAAPAAPVVHAVDEVRDAPVNRVGLQCRFPVELIAEDLEFDLDPLVGKVPLVLCDEKRNRVDRGHQTDRKVLRFDQARGEYKEKEDGKSGAERGEPSARSPSPAGIVGASVHGPILRGEGGACQVSIASRSTRSNLALIATITVERDIRIAPTSGDRMMPTPARTPAARGMATTL